MINKKVSQAQPQFRLLAIYLGRWEPDDEARVTTPYLAIYSTLLPSYKVSNGWGCSTDDFFQKIKKNSLWKEISIAQDVLKAMMLRFFT